MREKQVCFYGCEQCPMVYGRWGGTHSALYATPALHGVGTPVLDWFTLNMRVGRILNLGRPIL